MSQISVIVPVYKVENYLNRCVNSVLSQTFSDFDLILVEDGSPDRCPELCDEIASVDQRVTAIHQKNGGLSAARNSGIEWALKNSDSEWITFVDSDDWVHPQYLEMLLSSAKQNGVGVSMCQFDVTPYYHDAFPSVEGSDVAILKTGTAFQMEELDPNSACGRLFRKNLFQDIRFPVGKLHEDRFTTYKLLFQHPEVAVVKKPMYFYYVNPDGIVHSKWNIRKLDDLEATEQQMTYFQERNMEDMYIYTVKDYIHLLVYSLRNMKGHPEYRKNVQCVRQKLRVILKREHKALGLSFKKDFNTYKYAYPFIAKVYGLIWMR